ncbi:hypothetical protein CEP54_012129 [Fusarium duplospermum]|uniref:Uncharacterized protein n=1 Tax=Fusarium duplospermum TaxID=1325734 RepID=A0A428PAK3_9HYPO|nr:hypothetical protein CEP54_012129 [Fusarium duplospermum]
MASRAILLDGNPDTKNYYAKLVNDQKYALIPSLELETVTLGKRQGTDLRRTSIGA